MRIVVNNIAACSGGALSILKSFYSYLVSEERSKEIEWIFLLSDRYIEETENIKVIILDKVKKNWLNRLKFDLYSGKKIISSFNPDIVFSLQNTITFGLKYPQVVYMHQAIPFQKTKKFSFFKANERNLAVYQYLIGQLIKYSIKKADKTIVQTKWIREAVIEATKISPQKIIDIFPPQEDYTEYKKKNMFQSNSFFYPAYKNEYKNHNCIYEACSILKEKGIRNYNISLTIEDEIGRENISFLGVIPLEQVLERYNTSTLIFPSYIETVGLPLIEARQMGTVILAADCQYSREALDGYRNAYFFDPFNPNQLADLIERVIKKKIIKLPIAKINQKRMGNYGWKSVLDVLVKLAD